MNKNRKKQKKRPEKWRTVFTIRELLRKVRELQYYKDTTVGLWCIDRNPKTVSKQWIDENAFQL